MIIKIKAAMFRKPADYPRIVDFFLTREHEVELNGFISEWAHHRKDGSMQVPSIVGENHSADLSAFGRSACFHSNLKVMCEHNSVMSIHH